MEQSWIQNQTYPIRELALSSTLAATFIVTTFFPLSAFIGGAAFITWAIVMVPLIAAILRPTFASVAIIAGSLGMAVFQTGLYRVFGLPGLLIPCVAAILGSFAFHYKWGPLLPWAYVLAGIAYYLQFSGGGTVVWLTPYILVVASIPVLPRLEGTRIVVLLALYTAMAEQVTMNILSISLLGLPGGAWIGIAPFMFLERTIATLGSFVLIVALKNRLGTAIQIGHLVQREVR